MKIGVCKLCRQNKELCERSHIISNYAYKLLRDDDNLVLYIDKQTINKPGKQKRYTGEFEGNILCLDCESKISEYETYAVNLIFRNKIKNIKREIKQNKNNIKLLEISGAGYDYKKYKLYLLSILWRSSVSSRSFFKNVSLKVNDEENIRRMILNDNPGEIYDYPCFIILPALTHQNIGFDLKDVGLIRNPIKYEKDEIEFIEFLINGCHYQFSIIKEPNKTKFISVQKNHLVMPFLTEEQTFNRRNEIFNSIQQWF